jgi:DNA repair protein RadA/Sms
MQPSSGGIKARLGGASATSFVTEGVPLAQVNETHEKSYSTGLSSLDAILGTGLVPGAALLFGGEPGIGKSTLLLQLAGAVAASGREVLYISGEESLAQLKSRAERLGVLYPELLAVTSNSVEDALAALGAPRPPALLVVDSVQTLISPRIEGLPGSVSQVRAVAIELVEACKRSQTTLVLVGHVTKDGQLAGPKLLEHMVDTVISLEGERGHVFRILRVLKNRFGPNQELLIFEMLREGLKVVEDPSTFFLELRDPTLSGTAVVRAMDGQRPFAVEVQALVTRSFLPVPRRAALGFDVNRLHLLLAVLEKRLKLNFGQTDIYAKIGGGMKIQEPGMDLGLVTAVLSSFYDVPLPEQAAFWGEVDLNGQVRPVNGQDIRLKQAQRLGYQPLFYPVTSGKSKSEGVNTITALQRALFRKG